MKRIHSHKDAVWRKAVIGRDGECYVCGTKEDLTAHHLYSYAHFPQQRRDPKFGATLCSAHHRAFHLFLGPVPCTPKHFNDWCWHLLTRQRSA